MNAHTRTVVIDAETASLLDEARALGQFADDDQVIRDALNAARGRRAAVAHLGNLARAALSDTADLVEHDEVMREMQGLVDRLSGPRAA